MSPELTTGLLLVCATGFLAALGWTLRKLFDVSTIVAVLQERITAHGEDIKEIRDKVYG